MNGNHSTVLIIDDEPEIAEFVADVFELNGIAATFISDPDLLESTLASHIRLVVLDLLMPKATGVQLLERIANGNHRPDVILMCGETVGVIEQARLIAIELNITIAGTLNKPFFADELEVLIETLDVKN